MQRCVAAGAEILYSAGDLLPQYVEALEQAREEKGGVQQALADYFARVYKVSLPRAA
jgi:hypothetical protein